MERIVDDLVNKGDDKKWGVETKKRLKVGKRYLKTDYRVHCTEGSPCKDHCHKYALSDPEDVSFAENCDHDHELGCSSCEDMLAVLSDIKGKILDSSHLSINRENQEYLLYDFEQAKSDIIQWKAHVLRSVNQDQAKHDEIGMLDDGSAIVVMDWAMKFLQMKYREKQSEWFAKRGISWHVSTIITREEKTGSIEVQTYAHLIDSCQQDWFAVCSIIENLLKNIKAIRPGITSVIFHSDEAGCYHNNFLVASLIDIGKRVGIRVKGYDYYEPAYGKDVCDRILCPMKSAIRCYCNEGNDVDCAAQMRKALCERPVRGTTAAVCHINEERKTLDVKKD